MTVESNDNNEKLFWFALSAPYRKEMEAKKLLEKNSIECFIPMRYVVINTIGGKIRKLVPAISNLVFARTTKKEIQRVKTGVTFIQYKVRREKGKNVPLTVPEHEMQQFITVCSAAVEDIEFLSPDELNIKKGTPVRIIGGTFDGVEGVFIKLKGKRKKHVVVMIDTLAAVAVAEINPDFIQVIKD